MVDRDPIGSPRQAPELWTQAPPRAVMESGSGPDPPEGWLAPVHQQPWAPEEVFLRNVEATDREWGLFSTALQSTEVAVEGVDEPRKLKDGIAMVLMERKVLLRNNILDWFWDCR